MYRLLEVGKKIESHHYCKDRKRVCLVGSDTNEYIHSRLGFYLEPEEYGLFYVAIDSNGKDILPVEPTNLKQI